VVGRGTTMVIRRAASVSSLTRIAPNRALQ
jgi:hypothetical protein